MGSWQESFEQHLRTLLTTEIVEEKEFSRNVLKGMTWIFYKPDDREFMRDCLGRIAKEMKTTSNSLLNLILLGELNDLTK